MASSEEIDTVIIGNGPAALILSYILHGNIPYYSGGHNDTLLDRKLSTEPNLLNVNQDIYSHIHTSINYSTQALPVNVLLDTLLRPQGDTSTGVASCVEWRFEPEKAVPHIVLGDAPAPGGQWADNPVAASWDIGTLSYAEQLTLPGYSIGKHWRAVKKEALQALVRPTRREIADYLAAYPAAVGIQDAFRTSSAVRSVTRARNGFHVLPQNIRCKHMVLATGIFNINLPPPSFLSHLQMASADDAPLLVIGSGFTAADIIISTPPTRKIIHLFNWEPNHRPSPLKACHGSAYPDYAWIYKQMKIAGDRMLGRSTAPNQTAANKAPEDAAQSLKDRDWIRTYEGFGNARIVGSSLDVDFKAPNPAVTQVQGYGRRKSHAPIIPAHALTVEIGRSSIGDSIRRQIGGFRYAAGRRGSLSYLSMPLFQEVVPDSPYARRASSVSHDGFSDVDRPRTSDGQVPPRASSLVPNGRLALAEPDLRRASLSHAPKPLLGANWKRGSIDGSSAPHLPLENKLPQHLSPDPIQALRRGSAEIDFAFEPKPTVMISGQTLRAKIESGQDGVPFDSMQQLIGTPQTQGFEVAHDVFVIGSLSGDSLIRFAFGGCAVVAGKLMSDRGVLKADQDIHIGKLTEERHIKNAVNRGTISVQEATQPSSLEPLPERQELQLGASSAKQPQFNIPVFSNSASLPPTANGSASPSTLAPTTNQSAASQMFSENFSLTHPSTAAKPDVTASPTGRRNPSIDDVDPKHAHLAHMHLMGQDHAAVEAPAALAASNAGVIANANTTQRRASAIDMPLRHKELDVVSGSANQRKGSIFGKVKDKIAGMR